MWQIIILNLQRRGDAVAHEVAELEVRRGRTGDPRGVVGTSGTDKPKAVTGEDICGEGDPFSDVPPALIPPHRVSVITTKNVSQQITYTE